MTLTTEQLQALKYKILAEKIYPIQAIKQLHPTEDLNDLRTQLFAVYPRETLIQNDKNNEVNSLPIIEQRIKQLGQELSSLEKQKQDLINKNK
jgi:hypothetical protein